MDVLYKILKGQNVLVFSGREKVTNLERICARIFLVVMVYTVYMHAENINICKLLTN